MASIQDVTRKCAESFTHAIALRSTEPEIQSELQNELFRFKIGAGSLGVNAADITSADYCLRNNLDICGIFIGMLTRLERESKVYLTANRSKLQQKHTRNLELKLILRRWRRFRRRHHHDHLSAWTKSRFPHRNQPLDEIDDIITRLYQFTAVIKKSESQNEYARINRFIQKKKKKKNPRRRTQSHAKWHIETRLCEISPVLVQRLVNAAVF
ncbi:hypothetical protein K432DRAFT_464598 [Lepidopterella palustris CBS 459.81]|uniref:Uncharacterized protein n=1 Tax=Lepidopterella palustris CBS 459.81 TaxID=1314670 RepID=A0A8E2EH83_9PEZI|nr:hypothetical protein K432DRAFT_464598 [Lepidopterella palustris CBS 459.81]